MENKIAYFAVAFPWDIACRFFFVKTDSLDDLVELMNNKDEEMVKKKWGSTGLDYIYLFTRMQPLLKMVRMLNIN